MNTTRFDVVVTSYNYLRFLGEALDNALRQSRPPSRVIVVDDGSTDGSADWLQEHYGSDPRVVLRLGSNQGQLAAFRCGLEAAEADVVCFLDADDRWAPDYLEKIGALFDARKDIDFVFSDLHLFGDQEGVIRYAREAQDLGYTALATAADKYWYGAPTSAIALRRAWAERCLDLPPSMQATWRLSADNCLVFGASVLGARKYYLPTGSVGYRIHGKNGWWSQRDANSMYLNRMRSFALIAHYAQRAGIDDSSLELAKLEFLTKPAATWADARRYARLAWRSPSPWWKRLERVASILSHRLRKNRRRRKP